MVHCANAEFQRILEKQGLGSAEFIDEALQSKTDKKPSKGILLFNRNCARSFILQAMEVLIKLGKIYTLISETKKANGIKHV